MPRRRALYGAFVRPRTTGRSHCGATSPFQGEPITGVPKQATTPPFPCLSCCRGNFPCPYVRFVTSARAANPNLGPVQDLHVLLVPAGAVGTCFLGSSSRRHASVDAVTSTVLAVDRVPTANISVSDNSIGSARTRGEKGRRRRKPKQRLTITRRQARCKRSDDLTRHSRRVWSCGTMNRRESGRRARARSKKISRLKRMRI